MFKYRPFMKTNNSIGIFIRQRRIQKQISLRTFSRKIGVSPEYLSKIENGFRSAPNDEVLERITTELSLSTEEKEKFFDLSADSKSYLSLASDLILYIKANKCTHEALRIAKRCGANEEDWQYFISYLTNKYL